MSSEGEMWIQSNPPLTLVFIATFQKSTNKPGRPTFALGSASLSHLRASLDFPTRFRIVTNKCVVGPPKLPLALLPCLWRHCRGGQRWCGREAGRLAACITPQPYAAEPRDRMLKMYLPLSSSSLVFDMQTLIICQPQTKRTKGRQAVVLINLLGLCSIVRKRGTAADLPEHFVTSPKGRFGRRRAAINTKRLPTTMTFES
jgi:hypothetical protein